MRHMGDVCLVHKTKLICSHVSASQIFFLIEGGEIFPQNSEVTSTVYDVGPCAEGLDEQSEPSYPAGSAAGAATSFTFVQPQASTSGNAAGTGTVVFEVSTVS